MSNFNIQITIFYIHLKSLLSRYISLSPVPLPNLTISVNILAYSKVNFTCVIQSLTTPTVNWTTNMNVVLPPASFTSNHDNNVYTSTLTLEQVTLQYGEEYTCTAENEGGEISDMINVDVYGKEINMCIFINRCVCLLLCLCVLAHFRKPKIASLVQTFITETVIN